MMDINWIVIIIVSAIAFALAPIWFGALFGNLWMKIHGLESMSKEELKKQNEGMWKSLVTEAISTFVMVSVLAFFIVKVPEYNACTLASFIWIGFMVPNVISGVIWGTDKKEWQCTKIAILAGFNFVALMISAYILSIWL